MFRFINGVVYRFDDLDRNPVVVATSQPNHQLQLVPKYDQYSLGRRMVTATNEGPTSPREPTIRMCLLHVDLPNASNAWPKKHVNFRFVG